MGKIIFVYITNPSLVVANRVAKHLLKKKLIACANIFPINSLYPWKGKLVEEKEVVLIAKTSADTYEKVKKEIEKIHPYSVPCIIKIPVQANAAYARWLASCL